MKINNKFRIYFYIASLFVYFMVNYFAINHIGYTFAIKSLLGIVAIMIIKFSIVDMFDGFKLTKVFTLLLVVGLLSSVYIYSKKEIIIVNNFQDCINAGFPRTKSYPSKCVTDDGREFIQEVTETPNGQPDLLISGKTVCLSKIETGDFQTMECAIGFLSDDGKYYGFKNLEHFNKDHKYSTTDLELQIEGKLLSKESPMDTGFNNNSYDISGVIEITSLREIKNDRDLFK